MFEKTLRTSYIWYNEPFKENWRSISATTQISLPWPFNIPKSLWPFPKAWPILSERFPVVADFDVAERWGRRRWRHRTGFVWLLGCFWWCDHLNYLRTKLWNSGNLPNTSSLKKNRRGFGFFNSFWKGLWILMLKRPCCSRETPWFREKHGHFCMGILCLTVGTGTLADQEPSHFAHEFSLQLAALLGQAAGRRRNFVPGSCSKKGSKHVKLRNIFER